MVSIPKNILRILKSKKTSYTRFNEIESRHRPILDEGAFNQVALFRGFVVKWGSAYTARRDFALIQKFRSSKKWRRHFPETHNYRGLLVQERCDPNWTHWNKYEDAVYQLSIKLGIDDVKHENTGWRKGKNGPVPVFFDVNITTHRRWWPSNRPRRSWFVGY